MAIKTVRDLIVELQKRNLDDSIHVETRRGYFEIEYLDKEQEGPNEYIAVIKIDD